MPARTAVLLTAHGTVADLDELPRFLLRIRAGRPVPPELLAETRRRYALIGGSPLLRVTEEQAMLLERRLGVPVFVGMRLAEPTLEDALRRAEERGSEHVVLLPLAPFSVHVYAAAAEAARAHLLEERRKPPTLTVVPPWGQSSHFVRAHAQAIRPHLASPARLVLTAHSLPLVALRGGDPYADQVRDSAAAIGKELGQPFELAFQSQGEGGGEWLGPTLKSALEAAKRDGARRVVVAPIGFLSEHVETLYDLDIEARAWAAELGLEWSRVPALGHAEGLIEALADVAGKAAAGRA
ncbi:MAG TPA: ferrochelatase [Polyangiaceae bacterium]|nr:ferrochelatase [Polyangiaceae bacterium]